MPKKSFDFSDTTISKEEAEKRLASLGLKEAPGKEKKTPRPTRAVRAEKGRAEPPAAPTLKAAPTVAQTPLKPPAKYRGTPPGFIRFSYIVREDYHETMRAMAKEKGVSVREIMDKALERTVGKYVGKYKPLPDKKTEEESKQIELEKLF